jgi:REP element-mobilizing transposase RayT
MAEEKGWYDRGYLPHRDAPITQFVTFRLADSLPKRALELVEREIEQVPGDRRGAERRRRFEALADAGHGSCWLGRPEIAEIVRDRLLFRQGRDYDLHAWVVMSNHVHLLATLFPGASLPRTVQSWKARSARAANRVLRREGAFWARDFFDRYIRDGEHFAQTLRYIEQNPVKAGLCSESRLWRWSSAWRAEAE